MELSNESLRQSKIIERIVAREVKSILFVNGIIVDEDANVLETLQKVLEHYRSMKEAFYQFSRVAKRIGLDENGEIDYGNTK